jgi:hypothetical protein
MFYSEARRAVAFQAAQATADDAYSVSETGDVSAGSFCRHYAIPLVHMVRIGRMEADLLVILLDE